MPASASSSSSSSSSLSLPSYPCKRRTRLHNKGTNRKARGDAEKKLTHAQPIRPSTATVTFHKQSLPQQTEDNSSTQAEPYKLAKGGQTNKKRLKQQLKGSRPPRTNSFSRMMQPRQPEAD